MAEDTRAVDVRATYRHSAGRLGSVFLKALGDGRLIGWKSTADGRVTVPPRETGLPGEWVPIGPGARLEAFAPADWVADDRGDGACLALVRIDGADTALLARLKVAPSAGAPAIGARLVARFAAERSSRITDLWFELEGR